MGAPEAPLGGSWEEPEPRRGGAGPRVPVGLRRSELGQRCRRQLALRDGHIPLQGRAEAAALPPAPRTGASVRATPPAPGQTFRPPELWGLRRPAPARQAARPRAARLAGPAPGWGRGSATESGDGPPSGHRAAPGGLTDREDRRRWVWAGLTALWGRPGNAGAGGRGENRAVVSCGEPRRAATLPPVRSGQSLTSHNSCHLQEPRLDVKRMPQCPPSGLGGDMASLIPLSPYLSPTVLLLVSCDLGFVRADRPPSPVNVTVTHLRANSATVSWDVPEGNIVIGYSISQQRQNGPGQRVIREVNTTTRACALWGLAEDSDYTVQVRSIGLRGESPPGPRVHFRTLKGSDRLPSNSSGPGDITVEGLDGERPLQTGEVVIIVVVLLMWAAVIGLFCRQYDIIKDNDSNNNPKEKGKGPEQSPQGRPVGTRQKKSPSINTIDV
ncbi:hypothetical protein P7K49_028757 [Saguinus oedipus]|uniref:Fibronectin type-III domain-containing protein n=1 Tax=Saguinus oedipus TaxID=9490 RepID=A0ABQ9U610_SAGOE|nr:hypothetical protein P7K49_028757 [Saguinus oedipus]